MGVQVPVPTLVINAELLAGPTSVPLEVAEITPLSVIELNPFLTDSKEYFTENEYEPYVVEGAVVEVLPLVKV